MHQNLRRGCSMESSGYIGNSRVVLNHYDVSTQADIQHTAMMYESEDENMGRIYSRARQSTPLYSKEDIREQYCISDRGLGALETDQRSLFSCLTHQSSPCSIRTSLLTVCVKQKIPSDENLYDLFRRHPVECPGYNRRARYPWGMPPPEIYPYDEEYGCSYYRRKPRVDPRRYTWMPADDESVRLERPRSVLEYSSSISSIPPPPPPVSRPKHVSFARSHTLSSFEESAVSLSSSSSHVSKLSRSQERLLPLLGRRRSSEVLIPITQQPSFTDNVQMLEKFKRTPSSMKTQATQTEVALGRKPIPPSKLNLSPRTIRRVRMVSQGAQTNGLNGRKLLKSFSEVGGDKFVKSPYRAIQDQNIHQDAHEPLQRAHSDEPPRSPFILTSPPKLSFSDNDVSSSSNSEHESDDAKEYDFKPQKEIIIDFEPQAQFSPIQVKRKRLQKTVSDGEILLDHKMTTMSEVVISDTKITSFSSENIVIEHEPRRFTPYFQDSPIKNEGVCKSYAERSFSSTDDSLEGREFHPRDSLEEFHENLIYKGKYLRRSGSSTSDDLLDNEVRIRRYNYIEHEEEDEEEDERFCSTLFPGQNLSPFASSESLENELRDHSDGIWNESQVTVLQLDSGTDNGTALSSSERASLTTPSSGSSMLLTPSSRKKNLLLLQHQQRSSMDTDVLDEELTSQIQVQNSNLSPRLVDLPSISLSRPDTGGLRYSSSRSNTTPLINKKSKDFNTDMTLPLVVPDILPKMDVCKINADLSESTTTDDYVTATSGTDSSKKNGSKDVSEKQHLQTVQDGSSIESVSSTHPDDMVVPSMSPHTIPEEPIDVTSSAHRSRGRISPSGSSSSCGSYSLDGSCPEVPLKPSVPTARHVPSISEDERSTHYSSSGYYDSAAEDEHTLKPSKWTDDERKRRRRAFTLDVDRNSSSISLKGDVKNKQSKRLDNNNVQYLTSSDKSKRSKLRTRSPLRTHHSKKNESSAINQGLQETKMPPDRKPLTSDESSSGLFGEQSNSGQLSPKKSKKSRDNSRRKSIPRSPTGSRAWKRNDTSEGKSSSLPGTLARRKSSLQSNRTDSQSKSRLSPHSASPLESPHKGKHSSKTSPESTRLKALSAESLRSVSPGSDSVFYSDPSSHMVFTEHQIHCFHCGKEVDVINSTHHLQKRGSGASNASVEIVQPPAGFADSPRIKSGRLYKKLEKRFRSEERQYREKMNSKSQQDIRAKSEERGEKSGFGRGKLRPMALSNNSSLEGLRATDSSPSVLPAAPEGEDDLGVYSVPYTDSNWLYIDDMEEMYAWTKHDSSADNDSGRRDSISSTSTESENEFLKRYEFITHRMIHRRSCLEMYKRQALKSFEGNKKVTLRRKSDEFGFRIHGAKPVVISAIEPDTPAESSELEVGDIMVAVNGISVIDKGHTEVVKLAHTGSDILTLEVARTCDMLSPPARIDEPLFSGFLWRLSGTTNESVTTNKWIRRWFILKKDGCLYCYKSNIIKQLVGGTTISNCHFCKVDNASSGIPPRAFRFDLRRPGLPPLHFAADTEKFLNKWTEVLLQISDKSHVEDNWLEHTKNNLQAPPGSLQKTDCVGYLVKLGNQWKSWNRRYCVLKDSCLYFYQDVNAKCAFGVACLHGYRVQQTTAGAKRHAFEIVPSNLKQKHFYFYTESEADRRRWVAALEYSIDRWFKIC